MTTIYTCTALYEDAEIGSGEALSNSDAKDECLASFNADMYPSGTITLEWGEYEDDPYQFGGPNYDHNSCPDGP